MGEGKGRGERSREGERVGGGGGGGGGSGRGEGEPKIFLYKLDLIMQPTCSQAPFPSPQYKLALFNEATWGTIFPPPPGLSTLTHPMHYKLASRRAISSSCCSIVFAVY